MNKIYRPQRVSAVLFGLLVLALLTGPMLVLGLRLFTSPIAFDTFWLGSIGVLLSIAGACFLYWTIAAATMGYRIDQDKVVISWGLIRQVIPLGQVEGLLPASQLSAPRRWAGLQWPGYRIGKATIEEIGNVIIYSTHTKPSDLWVLLTPQAAYGISPDLAESFRADLNERVVAGAGLVVSQHSEYLGPLRLGIWHDRLAVLLFLLALALNASMFAYVLYFFQSLPDLMPLHFNLQGEVDFVGPRLDVLRLPSIALGLTVANFVFAAILHVRERLAAYLVVGMSVIVQLMFWVATTRIVN